MKAAAYLKSRDELLQHFSSTFIIDGNEIAEGQYNMVSAALINYMPEIPVAMHEAVYRNIILHKKLSVLEQSDYAVLDYVEHINLTDAILTQLQTRPNIICTFHTGSYRILNLFLTRHKIPYTLVIGKDILEQEGAQFLEQYGALPGEHKNDHFHIIDAEHPNVGLQMLRQIKKGHSLLLYMDGNTGSGVATTKNDNRCTINFLNQQLYARKGIAFLAHTANVPIITVASFRASIDQIKLQFFDPIFPNKLIERKHFAEQTTQQIYDLVTPIIRKYPEQWEAWLYIHKVAHLVRSPAITPHREQTATEKICFDFSQFGIFKVNGVPFLMQKSTYAFYQIDQQLYETLKGSDKHPIPRRHIEESVFNQLYEQGVIHYV